MMKTFRKRKKRGTAGATYLSKYNLKACQMNFAELKKNWQTAQKKEASQRQVYKADIELALEKYNISHAAYHGGDYMV